MDIQSFIHSPQQAFRDLGFDPGQSPRATLLCQDTGTVFMYVMFDVVGHPLHIDCPASMYKSVYVYTKCYHVISHHIVFVICAI